MHKCSPPTIRSSDFLNACNKSSCKLHGLACAFLVAVDFKASVGSSCILNVIGDTGGEHLGSKEASYCFCDSTLLLVVAKLFAGFCANSVVCKKLLP